MAPYKLRCTLLGHSMDVRAVTTAPFPEGAIITGSRDRSAKVWIPNDSNGYTELLSVTNHANFVSCVCVIPPSNEYPRGIILTGSNDHTICAFTLDSPEPIYKLIGHSNTVCALAAGKFGTVLSGSWDQTARVWLAQRSVMTLTGHSAAVWAATMLTEQGLMLTGSADKTIRLWKAGRCEHVFTGHTDCVRGLAVVGTKDFLSASNDATIRHWLLSGECLNIYYGHTNFVYALSVLPNGKDFVSVSEDRTARVWKNGECEQTLRLPAQSVWCVAALQNGDFVVGSSDGTARVFTCDPVLQASPEEIKALEEEVAKSSLSSGEIGDLKINELPGKEVLFEPGRKDGQTKMIRDGSLVSAYQWSASDNQWMKIGDVVGASGSTQSTSGKVLFEGKEYDYVFNVDIDESKAALKLPYNVSEDPWFAAQRFLDKNELNQMYLDQVANFIIQNTKGMSLGPAQPSTISDPFTGGARYVPGGSQESTASGIDPFTGSGRYVPPDQGTGTGDSRSHLHSQSKFLPQTALLTFDACNISAILGKLKEFNAKTGDGEHKVEDIVLEEVCKLVNPSASCSPEQISTLEKLLQWPHDILFPVMDVLRVSVKWEKVNNHFCCHHTAPHFLGFLLEHLTSGALPANQMLALRTLCNMMCQPLGEHVAIANRDSIISHVMRVLPTHNKNIQVAVCTVFLNFSVLMYKQQDIEGKSQCISALATVANHITDGEAQFRFLVSIGTLVYKDEDSVSLAKTMEILPIVKRFEVVKEPSKVSQCAADVEAALQ